MYLRWRGRWTHLPSMAFTLKRRAELWWLRVRPYRGVLINRCGTWSYWHIALGRWTIRIERKEIEATP